MIRIPTIMVPVDDVTLAYRGYGSRVSARLHQRLMVNEGYVEPPPFLKKSLSTSGSSFSITGADDVIIPPVNSRIISSRIPGAEIVGIPGAGHGLMYQYPDECTGIVLSFLTFGT